MITCIKCGNQFPTSKRINGKRRALSSRRYCLDCSPFGLHNTSQLHVYPRVNNEVCCKCSVCGREYKYHRKSGHTLSLCNYCMQKKRLIKCKTRAIEYKGGCCTKCGYNKCTEALDFHHVGKKDFLISSHYNRKWETLRKELDKCILLCANCHRELHSSIKNSL